MEENLEVHEKRLWDSGNTNTIQKGFNIKDTQNVQGDDQDIIQYVARDQGDDQEMVQTLRTLKVDSLIKDFSHLEFSVPRFLSNFFSPIIY